MGFSPEPHFPQNIACIIKKNYTTEWLGCLTLLYVSMKEEALLLVNPCSWKENIRLNHFCNIPNCDNR